MKKFLILCTLLTFALPVLAQDDAPKTVAPDQDAIIGLLNVTADWYKAQLATDSLVSDQRESTFRDTLKRNGERTLRSAIAFARAEVPLQTADVTPVVTDAKDVPETIDAKASRLQAAASQADSQASTLDTQLKQTNARIAHASGRQRTALLALRDKQQSGLQLARAQGDLLKTITGLVSGAREIGTGGFAARIGDYDKMLPDPAATTGAVPAKIVVADKSDTTATADEGGDTSIFTLVGDTLDLSRRKQRIHDLGTQSNEMRDAVQAQLTAVRAQLKAAVQQGDALAAIGGQEDAAKLADEKQQLDMLVARFKLLGAAVAPLAEQNVWVEASQRTLADWDHALAGKMQAATRALLVRIGFLLLAIMVPLLLAELAKRATHKYIHDDRRQRQLGTIRRTLLTIVIIVIITMNFFSEFGSLATYAGLLTAGLAVALQNVILSVVAHFFFVGRFGVRAGDRVTINGVTGDIIEIGIVRFYLMELESDRSGWSPTGRIVAFPNSILFQQSAFFKQVPGTHYSWHTVTVKLAAGTDFQQAQTALLAAIDTVFEDYAEGLRQQQSILEHSTRLKIAPPKPEGRLTFADTGMAFEGRYPVETGRADEIDNRVTGALLNVIHKNEALETAGTPQIAT